MNERHAYKIPQLNKWGVIDSTVLEIEIPSTIDASFLDIIKSNPHASFLYDNISYTLDKVDETNKKATFFTTSLTLWVDTKTKLWQPNLSFTFELPTTYSTGVYTYKIEFSELLDETWSRYTGSHTIASTDNQLTITLATELIYRYRVTVSAKTYFVIGKILTIDFTGETPNISLNEIALQGGSGGGSVSVDAILSTTSTNPVQNRVITSALNDKATVDTQYSFREGEILISGTEESCTIIGSGQALSDFASADHTHNYNDLTDKPTIPTKTSDLTNDSGFITADDVGNLNSIALSYASTMEILTSIIMPTGTIVENNNATFPEGITVNNHNVNL